MSAAQRPESSPADDVRQYYDQNSARFERWGQGGAAIHRAVWGPGVTSERASFHYVDDLVLEELDGLAAAGDGHPPRVLDLGCGLGASLLYLASRRDIRGVGVTLSPVQAARAAELVEAAGQSARVRCREGNFLALPSDLGEIDLAFSIEAFTLSRDAGRFFAEAARVLRPGGRLLVCDDFLSERAPASLAPREREWLSAFRSGWRVKTLITTGEASELAQTAGFARTREIDLTAYLELRRFRDRCIGALVAVGRFLPLRGEYWNALYGGDALQRALLARLLGYRVLVFERSAALDRAPAAPQ